MNTRSGEIMSRSTRTGWRVASAAGITAALLMPLGVRAQAGTYTVTVQQPGKGAPAGEIATGTVNGLAWQLTLAPVSDNSGNGPSFCSTVTGPLFSGYGGVPTCGQPEEFTGPGAEPAYFHEATPTYGYKTYGSAYLEWGPVAPDVSYLTAALSNGKVLTLHPVASPGYRYIAIAVPPEALGTITAYSSHGEIAGITPFAGPFGYIFMNWLEPGQKVPARQTALIGSGGTGDQAWWARVYLGPWGACDVVSGPPINATTCTPKLLYLAGGGGTLVLNAAGPRNNIVLGAAAPDVTRIVVTLPGGGTQGAKQGAKQGGEEAVRLVTVDGQKFWAFGYPKVAHWTAYDAAGQPVAAGPT
jgi:hypothetical protein